jgi:hypothetical protein
VHLVIVIAVGSELMKIQIRLQRLGQTVCYCISTVVLFGIIERGVLLGEGLATAACVTQNTQNMNLIVYRIGSGGRMTGSSLDLQS